MLISVPGLRSYVAVTRVMSVFLRSFVRDGEIYGGGGGFVTDACVFVVLGVISTHPARRERGPDKKF